MNNITNPSLAALAYKGRLLALEGIHAAASGHPGGSLSCMDALTTLYFAEMNIDPANPKMESRDRFVLSKGHCAPALYAVLALRGFFPTEDMKLLRSIRAHYSGHPDMVHVPGVDMSTGSLSQGLSAAVGMALAGKIKKEDYRVYAICGDGELAEGQIWEATMAAAKYHLNNLCVLVDVNGLQIDGATKDVMPTEPLDAKFAAFNCNVLTIDGHDFQAIRDALSQAKACTDKPTVILLKTVKGKGVSFMENNAGWHGKTLRVDEMEIARNELNAQIAEYEKEVG